MSELPSFPTPELRRDDGTLWEASWNTELSWAIGLMTKSRIYFFRQLERNPARRWWCPWRPKWRRTGETWEGGNFREAGFEHMRFSHLEEA